MIALAVAAGIGNLVVRRFHPDLWAGSLLVFVAALILLAGAPGPLRPPAVPRAAVHRGHARRRATGRVARSRRGDVRARDGPRPRAPDEAEIRSTPLLLIAADPRRRRSPAHPPAPPRAARAAGRGRARAGAARRGPSPDQEQPSDRRRPPAARPRRGRRGLRRHRRADPLDQRRPRPAGRGARRDGRRRPTAGTVAGEQCHGASDHRRLHSNQAQQLATIANELLANAIQHGATPVAVTLAATATR